MLIKLRNWNLYIFIHENAFENVIRKLAAISSRPQYVNAGLLAWLLIGWRHAATQSKIGFEIFVLINMDLSTRISK